MREIKFRGKRKDNGEWVYGGLILRGGRAWIKDANDKFSLRTISTGYADWRCVEAVPKTIGQFTGLHDKNGKEIYEGDIVKIIDAPIIDDTFVVEWTDGKEFCIGFGLFSCFEYEVIGNIHDNPDLKEVFHEA